MSEHTQYALISLGIQGSIMATLLAPRRGRTDHIFRLESVLPELAEGGYVIDRRCLFDHPDAISWVAKAPGCDGQIEGGVSNRLSAEARQTAAMMAPYMGGEFQRLALQMALEPVTIPDENVPEEEDESAGPNDTVSAAYLARYWGKRGARVGKRVGDILEWNDGEKQQIPLPAKTE